MVPSRAVINKPKQVEIVDQIIGYEFDIVYRTRASNKMEDTLPRRFKYRVEEEKELQILS